MPCENTGSRSIQATAVWTASHSKKQREINWSKIGFGPDNRTPGLMHATKFNIPVSGPSHGSCNSSWPFAEQKYGKVDQMSRCHSYQESISKMFQQRLMPPSPPFNMVESSMELRAAKKKEMRFQNPVNNRSVGLRDSDGLQWIDLEQQPENHFLPLFSPSSAKTSCHLEGSDIQPLFSNQQEVVTITGDATFKLFGVPLRSSAATKQHMLLSSSMHRPKEQKCLGSDNMYELQQEPKCKSSGNIATAGDDQGKHFELSERLSAHVHSKCLDIPTRRYVKVLS